MPTLKLPDRPGVIEASFIEGIPSTLANLERLKALNAFSLFPLKDEAGILPITKLAFGKG